MNPPCNLKDSVVIGGDHASQTHAHTHTWHGDEHSLKQHTHTHTHACGTKQATGFYRIRETRSNTRHGRRHRKPGRRT